MIALIQQTINRMKIQTNKTKPLIQGILSTRKAIASLRANERIRKTLDAMTDTDIPPTDQDSERSTNQELLNHPPSNIICSDCVWRTARAFIKEKQERESESSVEYEQPPSKEKFPLVTEEEFLLKISGVSVGPMIQKWREDGYNTGKVASLLAKFQGVSTQYTSGILPPQPPPAPPPLSEEEIAALGLLNESERCCVCSPYLFLPLFSNNELILTFFSHHRNYL